MSNVGFRAVTDPPGLEIQDRVSKRQFRLHTSSVPELTPADTKPFVFPVEEARRLTTETIRIHEIPSVNVRETDGTQVTHVDPESESTTRLPPDEYVIELGSALKTYLLVDTAVRIEGDQHHVELSFEAPVAIDVGARAQVRRPPTTVTTTRDIDDLRRALETVSSSLHTTSPERAYPTLRGHPPRLELGDELTIPASAEPPETGITVRVPRRLSALFTVASLSYYLGARIEFGDHFRLETNRGVGFDLEDPGVDRVLKHVFLLDCLVRTHGLYRQKPREYEALEPLLDLDLEELYGASPSERLEAYLSVPTTETEPYVPRWPSVAYVEPTPEHVTALPYLVDDLALVRTTPLDRYSGQQARRVALSRFVTAAGKARGASAVFEGNTPFVDVPTGGARHRAWVGDGIPLDATKFVTDGYVHQTEREPTDRHEISMTVVCNDASMGAELSTLESRYRPYVDQPLDVDIHEQVSTAELARQLRADIDFFHFIGHATEAGLECPDGRLDTGSLSGVGVDSFLLNACQSYEQGIRLVEGGAVGGIVTLSDVSNDAAVETGGHLARLLDAGFTLRNALLVARQLSVVGGQYTLVGDGRAMLRRLPGTVSDITYVESTTTDYEVTVDWLLDDVWRLGSMMNAEYPDGWRRFLGGSEVGPIEVTAEQLLAYLETVSSPVWIDDEFHWSTDVTLADLD